MIDLNVPPEKQARQIAKEEFEIRTNYLFGNTFQAAYIDEMTIPYKKECLPIEKEVQRLRDNSRRMSANRWHGMGPSPQVFDEYLGRICGTDINMLATIITVMFESMCFMPPSLIEDIVHVLNENEYEHVNRCRTCYHFKEDGCYLKGYKQAKNPQDFCSSHSSCTHGSDNQLVF